MKTRKLDNLASYISTSKVFFIALVGIVAMRTSTIDPATMTWAGVFILYILCRGQQLNDRRHVTHVYAYLSKRLPHGANDPDRVLKLSEKLVNFAINTANVNATIHAGVKHVLSTVNAEKSRQSRVYQGSVTTDFVALAEKTFENWRVKLSTESALETPPDTKGK